MTATTTNDFDTSALRGKAKTVANAIVELVRQRAGADATGGGCRAFYSPLEWERRGEQYGRGSVLVVVYDGGALRTFFNSDAAYDAGWTWQEAMRARLASMGYYAEECTGWYAAVYPA